MSEVTCFEYLSKLPQFEELAFQLLMWYEYPMLNTKRTAHTKAKILLPFVCSECLEPYTATIITIKHIPAKILIDYLFTPI